MTIFEALREDHDKQRALARQLVETSGDTEQRRALFAELRASLEAHAAAEERHFYVPLIKDDLTQEKARHSIAEHHEIDEMIESLEETDFSSPGWLPQARHLCERVHHHLKEEEREVFPLAGRSLDDDQKEALSERYAAEMAEREAD